MKLASEIRWQDRDFRVPIERIKACERYGYDAVFAAEGFGSDCSTPLGHVAAHTSRLTLGTRIAQVTGRSPGVTAMSFQTLSAMADGRVIAGLGSSSPEVSAGLHARPWGSPLHRMRDFVTLLRQGFSGQPLKNHGREIDVPADGGAPMSTFLQPTPHIPILVGAAGPKMISTTAEIADGWFPAAFSPGMLATYMPLLEEGFRRAGNGKSISDFQVWAHVDVLVDDDVRAAMRKFKEYVAMWPQLQHAQLASLGYPELSRTLQELTAAGRHQEAIEAVPDEYIDHGWLVGPLSRIARNLDPWLSSGLTGLIIRYGPQGPDQRYEEPDEVFKAIADAVKG